MTKCISACTSEKGKQLLHLLQMRIVSFLNPTTLLNEQRVDKNITQNTKHEHEQRVIDNSPIITCSRPFCPKLEIQHNRRGRDVPTVTIKREEKMVL